jgi:predicted nucleic acid-binding Zn ribbon protein
MFEKLKDWWKEGVPPHDSICGELDAQENEEWERNVWPRVREARMKMYFIALLVVEAVGLMILYFCKPC